MTLLGNKVIVNISRDREVYGKRVDPNVMTAVLVRRRGFGPRPRGDTHSGRRPCEDRERDWSNATLNRRSPKMLATGRS